MDIDEIIETFELLDDWEQRYQFIIDLGKKLPPMAAADKNERTKVEGCVSNVWLTSALVPNDPPALHFTVDSDAFIVRGLAYLLLTIYSGRAPQAILATDAGEIFHRLGLDAHLSPTRANGLHAMTERIRAVAREVAGASGGT